MPDFPSLLLATIVLRPYVFAFLAGYLALARADLGWRRALLFTGVAYSVALLAEWNSAVAGTGFPFGQYRYITTTAGQEVWVAGVPLMDSLSFAFLAYISWRLAGVLLGANQAGDARWRSWRVTFLGAVLMVGLDLVIDPVTLLGDRWFLGRIYYYPQPGPYFGVTLENFAGWFLVSLAIIRLFLWLERRCLPSPAKGAALARSHRFQDPGPAVLFGCVAGFNLAVTFWIGEPLLGAVSCLVMAPILAWSVHTLRRRHAAVRPVRVAPSVVREAAVEIVPPRPELARFPAAVVLDEEPATG
jgi:uncharacterized membrane protein